MFSNYRGITLLSLSGKVCFRVVKRRLRPVVEPLIQEEQRNFGPSLWNGGSALHPLVSDGGSLGVCPCGPHVFC